MYLPWIDEVLCYTYWFRCACYCDQSITTVTFITSNLYHCTWINSKYQREGERLQVHIYGHVFFLPYLMDFCSFSSNHTSNQLQKNKIKLLLFAKQNNEKHEYVTNSYLCVWVILTSFGILMCCIVVAGWAVVLKANGGEGGEGERNDVTCTFWSLTSCKCLKGLYTRL